MFILTNVVNYYTSLATCARCKDSDSKPSPVGQAITTNHIVTNTTTTVHLLV